MRVKLISAEGNKKALKDNNFFLFFRFGAPTCIQSYWLATKLSNDPETKELNEVKNSSLERGKKKTLKDIKVFPLFEVPTCILSYFVCP